MKERVGRKNKRRKGDNVPMKAFSYLIYMVVGFSLFDRVWKMKLTKTKAVTHNLAYSLTRLRTILNSLKLIDWSCRTLMVRKIRNNSVSHDDRYRYQDVSIEKKKKKVRRKKAVSRNFNSLRHFRSGPKSEKSRVVITFHCQAKDWQTITKKYPKNIICIQSQWKIEK